jgi:hypothetical protein
MRKGKRLKSTSGITKRVWHIDHHKNIAAQSSLALFASPKVI